MKSIFLLCALSIALLGAECDKSQRPAADSTPQGQTQLSASLAQQGAVAPIPEPSAALIFSLGLCIACVVASWQAGKR